MKFLIIEDDYNWSKLLLADLRDQYGEIQTDRIATERELSRRISSLDLSTYSIALVDLIVRFDNMPTVGELTVDVRPKNYVETGGRFLAGLRCAKCLRDAGLQCPIIVYSASARPDELNAPSFADLRFLHKDEVKEWFMTIDSLIGN